MAEDTAKKFFTFRASASQSLEEAGIMDMVPPKGPIPEALYQCIENGYQDGAASRVIFSGFGLSLVHVWFKRSFPLPLHSHDADCVYYIIGGSVRLGTEDFGVGDGFFVPAGVPYTYRPGPEGVELIEVRNKDRFDYHDKSSAAFWKKALKTVEENKQHWIDARPLLPIGE